jgi:hypothetical protein
MFIACDTYLVVCYRWQCQYGPKDKSDTVLSVSADKVLLPMKYNNKGKRITSGHGHKGPRMIDAQEGGSIKWDCQCMFYVKRYYFMPDVVEIFYFSVKHVSLTEVVVHDKSTVRDKMRYAKHISEEIREFVWNLYLTGVPLPGYTVCTW